MFLGEVGVNMLGFDDGRRDPESDTDTFMAGGHPNHHKVKEAPAQHDSCARRGPNHMKRKVSQPAFAAGD